MPDVVNLNCHRSEQVSIEWELGDLLGKLRLPQIASNLCFGGPKLNHLSITATSTLYTLQVNINGLR